MQDFWSCGRALLHERIYEKKRFIDCKSVGMVHDGLLVGLRQEAVSFELRKDAIACAA